MTSTSENLYDQIDKAIDRLPENIASIMTEARTRELEGAQGPVAGPDGEGATQRQLLLRKRLSAVPEAPSNGRCGAFLVVRG